MNRGELKHYIEIWEKQETDETDELGEKIIDDVQVASMLAKKEFKGGGLLVGRPADSVLTKTTHKFTYVYNEFPNLVADKHYILHNGIKYDILYTLNEGETDEFLQVFVSEREYK